MEKPLFPSTRVRRVRTLLFRQVSLALENARAVKCLEGTWRLVVGSKGMFSVCCLDTFPWPCESCAFEFQL